MTRLAKTLGLTEFQTEIIATVREFVDKEITAHAPELERTDTYPQEIVDQMRDMGLFGLMIPQEYGGLGESLLTYALCVEELARCCPRLESLILGVGDLSASQGMKLGQIGHTDERYPGDIWHFARARMVVAARAAGIDAIDGPYASFRQPEGYVREAARAAALGFVGKWCIHPSQIELANQVFSPTEEEIANARKVIAESRHELEAITQALMEYETISGDEVQALMRGDKITRKPDDEVPRDQSGSAVPSAGGRFRPSGGTGPMEPQPQS